MSTQSGERWEVRKDGKPWLSIATFNEACAMARSLAKANAASRFNVHVAGTGEPRYTVKGERWLVLFGEGETRR